MNRIYANRQPKQHQVADTTTPIDILLAAYKQQKGVVEAASTALEQHTDSTNSIEQLIMRTRIEIQPEEISFTGFF
jgi:hypothetical protein